MEQPASVGHASTRRKRRHSPHAPQGTAADAEGWAGPRPLVGVAHAGAMARVEAARMPQVAGVCSAPLRRAHPRTAPAQPGAHAPACSAGVWQTGTHVDDLKVMAGRSGEGAPLPASSSARPPARGLRPDAWSVENGVRHKALSAGPALVAKTRGGARESPLVARGVKLSYLKLSSLVAPARHAQHTRHTPTPHASHAQ